MRTLLSRNGQSKMILMEIRRIFREFTSRIKPPIVSSDSTPEECLNVLSILNIYTREPKRSKKKKNGNTDGAIAERTARNVTPKQLKKILDSYLRDYEGGRKFWGTIKVVQTTTDILKPSVIDIATEYPIGTSMIQRHESSGQLTIRYTIPIRRASSTFRRSSVSTTIQRRVPSGRS